MSEIFKIKNEVRWMLYIRPRSSSSTLDKTSNWLVPLWGTVISPHCWLYQSISNCQKAYIHDSSPHSQPLHTNICWIQLARHTDIRQWTLLCQWNLKQLMTEYQVNHITCSPHYPQSNGLAENYIQIIKNFFHKAKEEEQDLYKCLMTYRNTPLSSTLQSPMQILSNRITRCTLPLSNAAKWQMGLPNDHLRTNKKKPTSPNTWLMHRSSCHVPRCDNEEMVSSKNNQAVWWTQKLYYLHRRRGTIQKDSETLKTSPTETANICQGVAYSL